LKKWIICLYFTKRSGWFQGLLLFIFLSETDFIDITQSNETSDNAAKGLKYYLTWLD